MGVKEFFQEKYNFFKSKKYTKNQILIAAIILINIVVISFSYFAIQWFSHYSNEQKVLKMKWILENGTTMTKDVCSDIFQFDSNLFNIHWFSYLIADFNAAKRACHRNFDVSQVSVTKENCKNIIGGNSAYFSEHYAILDGLEEKRAACTDKFLKVSVKDVNFFDVENNFKSAFAVDFSMPFYTDKWEKDSKEFINNRSEAKKRLIWLLDISPDTELTEENIVLYQKKAIIYLNLNEKTNYTISINSFNSPLWTPTEKVEYNFETPENTYLGIRVDRKVTLFKDTTPPKFTLYEYNSDQKEIEVQLCNVSAGTYGTIEVQEKRGLKSEAAKKFFLDDIDTLKNYKCFEKKLQIPESEELKLQKIEFDFEKEIWSPALSGLFVLQLKDKKLRISNGKIQAPVFFGIVDSHITMKISRNWEWFFFVNDFEGNPLKEQKIRLYSNDFQGKKRTWNVNTNEPEFEFFEPRDGKNPIWKKAVLVWETNENGILKVNLKDKFPNVFDKTLANYWDEQNNEKYNSFFVMSSSKTNLSYVNSRFNGWIEPENFGYKIGWSSKDDEIKLAAWGRIGKEMYSHIFTDRVLYLPNETVYVKGVLRNSNNLSIPEWEKISLMISNPKWEEIINKELIVNEFGSISYPFKLNEESTLWNYSMRIEYKNEIINHWGFQVEVFKNPKFKTEVLLQTTGLENNYLQEVVTTKVNNKNGTYSYDKHTGKFQIQAELFSKYFNGLTLEESDFKYKVYKQSYYGKWYWDNCYYWCYWEPNKEFYSEWKWKLDEKGYAKIDIDIDFSSSYDDYKYIVEVEVKDKSWDVIASSNSIVAKLPESKKTYNKTNSVAVSLEKKFFKQWENIKISARLFNGKWSKAYNNQFILALKKKEYNTEYVEEVRGYKRPVTTVQEKIEKVFLINDSTMKTKNDGTKEFIFPVKNTGEYVVEYAKIDLSQLPKNKDISFLDEVFKSFNSKKIEHFEFIWEDEKKHTLTLNKFFNKYWKKYKTFLVYGNTKAKHPILDDNKIQILSEKISYKLWEKARVLIRLPYENAKILWTVEKQGVVSSEYIDVPWNTFFKEIEVDDTFIPNAYLSALVVDTRWNAMPEYKVGYTEIVVDKTQKKSDITINTDKKIYKPRDKVQLDIHVKDVNKQAEKTELTIMVIDDSLISLMWNIDGNILEKMYKKLPFQIQTQITALAMMKNYYFSRPGIVGWSGHGSFKGWDSAISSRTIFKNTAYYNPSIITNDEGIAKVEFELPDNLTTFRVIAVSNSKNNTFGYQEKNILVQKNIIIEDKTPKIIRVWDEIKIWANIFNTSSKNQTISVKLESSAYKKQLPEQIITIQPGASQLVQWKVKNERAGKEFKYKISAIWENADYSDAYENIIPVADLPMFAKVEKKSGSVKAKELYDAEFKIPNNTDLTASKVVVTFSNNKLAGIDSIVRSLLVYPYWCIEQTTSSTYPNAVLKKFNSLFSGIVEEKEIDKNLEAGIARIQNMQNRDGWFMYWPGGNTSDMMITPYVLRSLLEMRDMWAHVPESVITKATKYLENNFYKSESLLNQAEMYWALSLVGKAPKWNINESKLSTHGLLAYKSWKYVGQEKINPKIFKKDVELLQKSLAKKSSDYYWNSKTDNALFLLFVMENDSENQFEDMIDQKIGELYKEDWTSYYYSTKTKNTAFRAFAKYIEKQWKTDFNAFGYSLWKIQNRNKVFTEWTHNVSIIKQEYTLREALYEKDKLELRVANLRGWKLYVDFKLYLVPEDKTTIKPFSNKISVERKIYEVLDDTMLSKCRKYYWNEDIDCSLVLKEVTNNTFVKGKLYKTEVKVLTDRNEKDITMEDYLPTSFIVENPNFKTSATSVTQSKKQWDWDYSQMLADRVMAYNKHSWGWDMVYEYYFRPKFEGKFMQPPVSAYKMYEPDVRAFSKFNTLEVISWNE